MQRGWARPPSWYNILISFFEYSLNSATQKCILLHPPVYERCPSAAADTRIAIHAYTHTHTHTHTHIHSRFQVIGDVVSYREQMKWFFATPTTPAFSSARCVREIITHLSYLSAGSKRCQRMLPAVGAGELRVRRLPNPTMNDKKSTNFA
jgi:hypothetical protein